MAQDDKNKSVRVLAELKPRLLRNRYGSGIAFAYFKLINIDNEDPRKRKLLLALDVYAKSKSKSKDVKASTLCCYIGKAELKYLIELADRFRNIPIRTEARKKVKRYHLDFWKARADNWNKRYELRTPRLPHPNSIFEHKKECNLDGKA